MSLMETILVVTFLLLFVFAFSMAVFGVITGRYDE